MFYVIFEMLQNTILVVFVVHCRYLMVVPQVTCQNIHECIMLYICFFAFCY